METNKLLNYAIWATVIGGGLFLLYKKYGKGGTKLLKGSKEWTLQEIQAKYPNWKLETSKTTNNPYYSKSFWTTNKDGSKFKEMWFIFYHNNYTIRKNKVFYLELRISLINLFLIVNFVSSKILLLSLFKITESF